MASETRDGRPEALPAEPDDPGFLQAVGDRLRLVRTQRGMPRRLLAERSGVSERYIAQMEVGRGNVSILLLRALCHALDIPPASLFAERPEPLDGLLLRLSGTQREEARAMLLERFGTGPAARRRRIALVGMRGAGKSTLGRLLAEQRGVPFYELDGEIEREAGMRLAALFERQGQSGYRRLERVALHRLVTQSAAVIATGGSLVAEPGTFDLLLSYCRTVWIVASPEEHMRRVVEQGDLRPMHDNVQAMQDLRAILASREPLYRRAELVLDTTDKPVGESLRLLAELVEMEPAPATR